jgi:hypothetical protein
MYIHARRGIYQDRSKTASPQLPVIKGSASPHGLRASVISFRRNRCFGVSARLGLFARKLLVAVIHMNCGHVESGLRENLEGECKNGDQHHRCPVH